MKGLTNLHKARKVKAWLKQHDKPDALVPTKVKVTGQELEKRIKEIDKTILYVHTLHDQGLGEVVLRINKKLESHIKGFQLDWWNQWVAFEPKGMVLVGVYATGPQAQRSRLWELLRAE